MVYTPGLSPLVFQAKAGPPNPCSRCHVVSGYWTQYSYSGVVHPVELAVRLTVAPAGWVEEGGETEAPVHGALIRPEFGSAINDDSSTASNALAGMVLSCETIVAY